mmetsp:Transcript_11369/g.19424  ORF Transcript_11369/g.19424 Transcript_11369/m.19424 type:complete len:231 (-) Transcript_11369:502-1194(-)
MLGVLLEEIALACHGGLVQLHRLRRQHQSVRHNLVTGGEHDHIAHKNLVDRNLMLHPGAQHIDPEVFVLGVQVAELEGLLVVIDGSNKHHQEDGKHDARAVIPSRCRALYGNAGAQGCGRTHHQQDERGILSRFVAVLPEGLCRLLLDDVSPEGQDIGFLLGGIFGQSDVCVDVQALGHPLRAAHLHYPLDLVRQLQQVYQLLLCDPETVRQRWDCIIHPEIHVHLAYRL